MKEGAKMGFKEKLNKYKELAENVKMLESRLSYYNYLDKKEMKIEKLTISYNDNGSRREIGINILGRGDFNNCLMATYEEYIGSIKDEIEEIEKQIEELEGGE